MLDSNCNVTFRLFYDHVCHVKTSKFCQIYKIWVSPKIGKTLVVY